MRTAILERKTKETAIKIELDLDGAGECKISTGIGFFDHMLEAFAFRAGIGLRLECVGDLEVDAHHTVEDVGICLGQAILDALGERRGIVRYANCALPMDEALVNCAADISGRGFLVYNAEISAENCGDFPTELAEEFFRALAHNAGITLHINLAYGKNAHHILEAIFKAAGLVLGTATRIISDKIPSTKGVL